MAEEYKKEKEKETLEFLFDTLSGLNGISIELGNKQQGEIPSSDIEKKKILLDENEDYNENKSEGLKELGHIWLSGSLKNVMRGWNVEKYGQFGDFRAIVNMLEDMRTENLLTIRYPQLKNRLTNLHIKKINEFLEKNPNYTIKDPRAALYVSTENRFKIPLKTNPQLKNIVDKLDSIAKESDFKNKNWKHMVNTALKISEEYNTWDKKRFEKLNQMLQKAMAQAQNAEQRQKEKVSEQKVNQKCQFNKLESKKIHDNYIKHLKENLKKLNQSKSDSEESKKHKKELEDKIKDYIGESKEEVEKFEKLEKEFNKLQKESDEIYEKDYKPAIEKQTKVAEMIAKAKGELKGNFDSLPKTFQHRFEDVNEENEGEGSSLDKDQMEEMKEKETEKSKKQQEQIMGSGEDGTKPIDRPFNPEEGTTLRKDFPQVDTSTTADKFAGEGEFPIPDLKLALAMGYEISSILKRELKLKAVTLKKRLYGVVDIKAVKKQMAKYGTIINPRVMKIKKELVEKHSVLVLTDFSGSMGSCAGGEYPKIQHAKQALVTLGKTLESLKVRYSLRGFSAKGGQNIIDDIILKDFDDPDMDYKLIDKVFYPNGSGENRDGDSIRYASTLLLKERGKKMMIVISDGLPNHPSGRDVYSGITGEEDTIAAVKEAENDGIHIMGISIDRAANNFVMRAYPNSFIFNDLKSFPQELTKSYIKTIMR